MTVTLKNNPADEGFRMPGEFEPHDGCWMIWPERTDNWRMGAKPAEKAFVEVAMAISRFEPVTMCVSGRQFVNARNKLPAHIRVIEMSNNDSWMRDIGPTFVTNNKGGLRLIDWDFNAWGGLEEGLYFPWDQDDLIPQKVAEITGIDRYKAPLVMEGGSIHTDGEGTLLTTEECLLNPNRNPHLSKAEIEAYLVSYLNVQKVIWLPRGCFNDETNGHIDNICCFVRPGVVLLAWTDDKDDPQHEISQEALDVLQRATDARGRELEVHKLRLPAPVLITAEECEGVDSVEGTIPRAKGDRMAASYVNFYIANSAVIAPVFNDPADQAALDKLKILFPEREIVSIYAREILLGGGNIHCITQQQPKP
jgi:agmatine deiminase